MMPAGWPAAAAAAFYLLGVVLLGRLGRQLTLRAIDARWQGGRSAGSPPGAPGAWGVRWSAAMTILARCWLILGLAGVLAAGYARWVMEDLRLGSLPLVGKLAAVVPFVVALVGAWILDYPCHRRIRLLLDRHGAGAPLPTWTLGRYLAYNIRHQLLFIAVPVGLIVLLTDALRLYARPVMPQGLVGEYLLVGACVAAAVAVFLVAPIIIVRIWRTEPLPDGAVRRSLERIARRMGFGFRDIRLWLSGGVVANAGVMGLLSPLRYVLISDALLENMEQESIEAVFAHEAGHVVSHHLPYMAAFAISSAVLCGAAADLLAAVAPSAQWAGSITCVALLVAAWSFGFGWISRRFERQSDVIAASAGRGGQDGRVEPESAAVFAHALQQVAMLNAMPTTQHNWRHGSIAARVGYLRHLAASGGTSRHIDRVVRRIKIGLLCALACAAAVLALQVVVEMMKWTQQ